MYVPAKSDIFSDAAALPSPPTIVLELLSMLGDEEVGMSQLADVVERDAALAGDLLRLANSAAHGLQGGVSRLDRAMSTIGLRAFRALLAKRSMRDLIPDDTASNGMIRRRSVVNATLARAFGQELDELIAEDVFLVGLLGSLGHLALARSAGELFGLMIDESPGGWPRTEMEQQLLGFSIDEITADLLRSWGMPESLTEAVELRSSPVGMVPRHASADGVTALRWARLGEHVLCGNAPSADLSLLVDDVRNTEAHTGVGLLKVSEILVETEPLVIELAADLRFDVPEPGHHARVLESSAADQLDVAPR